MRKKTDLNLVVGIIIFSIGLGSALYSFIVLIIDIIIWYTGIIIYLKDLLFELVFILIGFLIIRKYKNRS